MTDTGLPVFAHPVGDCLDLRLKVVPGASRERIAGILGDRLKIQIRQPPEGGKANKAVLAMLSRALGCRRADLELVAGATQALKTVRYHRPVLPPDFIAEVPS